MQPFTAVTGQAAQLPHANIDTDVIIRIERLTQNDQSRLGDYALEALRFRADGSEDPSFVLNQPRFRDAPILLCGPNFGCGSSREGAVVALAARGIRAIIAPSFGDIFYGNCFQNGLLAIRLPEAQVEAIAADVRASDAPVTVDLERCLIVAPGGRTIAFEIDPLRRQALLEGLDDIGQTALVRERILDWQARDRAERPWIWDIPDPVLAG
ncbi:3-isopropylmalate dehydratase small subunit [Sphingomonas oligophenolica]|uniref:3-isopropylmalate dehydratase n=1 Tax=Sphingomonas oligophenolica TaxID=301154 RepID=A0ABU9Y8R2_9SPHN